MEYAKSGVLNEEVRRKSEGSSLQRHILVTEDRGRDKTRGSWNRGAIFFRRGFPASYITSGGSRSSFRRDAAELLVPVNFRKTCSRFFRSIAGIRDIGRVRGKNEVGINLRELVVEFKRVNDRLMATKIVVGGYILNVVSAYAPQVGLGEEVKRRLWDDLDGLVRGIPSTEKLIIGCDFNGHIGRSPGGYDDVHGGFGFGDRNGGGTSLLEYVKAFEMVIANSYYPKKAEHLITFRSAVAKTQIDYLLLRKCDRGLCTDCKVIPSENLTTHHMLLIMDLEITWTRKKRAMSGIPRVRWGALTKDKAQELGEKLLTMGAWRSSGDASCMWSMTTNCIREAAREVLGASKGFSVGHKREWWWNEEVQRKVEAKKATYLKLVKSIDEGQKSANREGY
ncbi:PREDICTED: uncharacterized protein LOC109224364 [Nicotiana attenuata]|uniref:uncharacterized protein LOC109224364 n=1 Tax=Nicotiana attenuata TaxID=49451 RepID=UPI000904B605|nr:PREDICTED: uncharacterized protein LOC109224364 [Nicotiana attenuata]